MIEVPMISYGLNWEDVRLERAFAGQASGFYVDVGAYDPVKESLTKHLYDRGWSGINIEPHPLGYDRLVAERTRDVNLKTSISSREGSLPFYEPAPEYRGLATLEAEQARRHREAGLEFTEREVPVTTLATVLGRHAHGPIDLMSVDVEGHERHVLEGNDWSRWRPRVVVIEATAPLTKHRTHGAWEPILLSAGYIFAAFDGLNRYYVSEEGRDLADALGAPVSVLDAFVPHELHEARGRLAELQDRSSLLEERLAAAQVLRRGAESDLAELRHEFERLAERCDDLAVRTERTRRVILTLRPQYEQVRAATADHAVVAERLLAEAERARVAAETTCARLELFRDVGPLGIEMARWLRRMSQRHRGIARIAKLPVRAIKSRAWGRRPAGDGAPPGP